VGQDIGTVLDRNVPDWRGDSPSWEKVGDIPGSELWNARAQQRRRMIEFVGRRVPGARLDPNALTLVWARRFAEYKRAGLLARDMARLRRIMANSERPVQLVISGKAHPMDEGAKRIMQGLLRELETVPEVAPHVAFVPDYSITVGQELTAGADVWVNTPRKPLEASGTSGMKSGDNGGLQLTVQDGWAAEVSWWQVGWGIEGRDDSSDADQLYYFLENSVTPCFYTRDESDVPQNWVKMMKNSMQITLSRYSARRMVLDYLNKLYLPLLEQQGIQPLTPSV
jgi:starch phosphorylase